ncbi:MAG TPA: metallophosphoesterase [Anaerolineaceae bacterium]|nr:metallophosphoesterase [Anaerolineaceae bacterium]
MMGMEGLAIKEIVRIGVLSDTHIPDRVRELHPEVIPTFTQQNVDLIIHAGDICTPKVIMELEEIAPVLAVRGNRDFWLMKKLPDQETITINGVKIFVTHGQGNILSYVLDKIPNFIFGYRFERFFRKILPRSKDFDLFIFGHSHRVENKWIEGKLFFNPGSASEPGVDKAGPSIGLIEIWNEGRIEAQIIRLENLKCIKGKWVRFL